MSLTELWKNSREQFENKHVQQVIAFSGEGKLRDGSIASVEFREFLSNVSSEVLCQYSEDCLSSSFNDSGFALQDIVNQVGSRLGFEVEDGRYQGSKNNLGNDGLWRFPSGHHVVVEVKTTDVYRIDTNKIAEYRRKLITSDKVSEENSSILIVVGREDTGDLEAQIRGSRHAWDLRLISVDSLLRMMLLKESVDDPQIIQRICEILIPKEFTRLDNIVDIVFSATEEAKQDEPDEKEFIEEKSTDSTKRQPFKRTDKPVNFNELCVKKFESVLAIDLIRRTKTKYSSADKKTNVVCLVSKDYDDSYWFGLRDYQEQFLEESENGYLLLGCGTSADIFAMEINKVRELLGELNTSENENGKHWHFHVYEEAGQFVILKKEKRGKVDISQYKI